MTTKKLQKELKIKMVKGLLGFDDILDYTLKPIPENPFFFWLKAEDGPGFVLTKPGFFFEDYKAAAHRETLADLKVEKDEPEVYLIVTVPDRPEEMTANLLAPLLLNEKEGLGLQMVLENKSYLTRHYLFPEEKRKSCG